MSEIVSQTLPGLLQPGEQVLWSGAPAPFRTMDEINGKSVRFRLFLKGGITVVLAAAYCLYAIPRDTMMIGVPIVILALGALLIGSQLNVCRKMRVKGRYAITDRRAFAFMEDGGLGASLPLEKISLWRATPAGDGCSSIRFGAGPVALSPEKEREAAIGFLLRESGEGDDGCIFYHLAAPAAGEAAALLTRLLKK